MRPMPWKVLPSLVFQAGVGLAEAFEVGKFVLEVVDKSICDQCLGKSCQA